MPLQTKTVERDGIKITVSRASIAMGAYRSRLRARAFDEKDERHKAQLFEFADLAAVTVAIEGMPEPLTPESLDTLDEELGMAWEAAVYELNPHWYQLRAEEKKAEAPTSTGES